MAVQGAQYGSMLGGNSQVMAVAVAGGVSTYAMPALNNAWCARILNLDTRDIASVVVCWATTTAAGTVQLRAETIDATTGKPSGSLYDSSAVLNFTPSAGGAGGFQTLTFATLPTAGRTVGAELGIMLLTTVAGTAHTLRGTSASNMTTNYPTQVMTAADGTTRGNFATVSASMPVATIIFEDGSEEHVDMCPYTTTASVNVFGTAAAGAKITVPAGQRWLVSGVNWIGSFTGSPAGDLRLRILNSSDGVVATATADKDSLILAGSSRRCQLSFSSLVTLNPGVYYIQIDSAASVNSSNCWVFRSCNANAAATVSSGCVAASTADNTANPIVYTVTTTQAPALNLVIDSITGASPMLVNGGLAA